LENEMSVIKIRVTSATSENWYHVGDVIKVDAELQHFRLFDDGRISAIDYDFYWHRWHMLGVDVKHCEIVPDDTPTNCTCPDCAHYRKFNY